ncbi:hypothetical protein H7X65_03380 [Candidatus Parcubacteria bacterium]|nr:hypothetical protein [Candidatus Parcubacteria bacterium]
MNTTLTTAEEAFTLILDSIIDGITDVPRRLGSLSTAFGFRDVIRFEDKGRCAAEGIKGILEIPPNALSQGKFLGLLIMLEIELGNPESKPGTIPGDTVIRLAEAFDFLMSHITFNLAEILVYKHVRSTLLKRG